MSRRTVVIVGGGLSGLAAAVQLGRLGVAALVCHEGAELGGRAGTLQRGDFHLNYGSHRLYARGAGVAALRKLGIEIDAAPRGPNGGLAVCRGRTYTLPVGFCSLLATDLLSARAKQEFAQLLTSMRHVRTDTLEQISIGRWLGNRASDPGVKQLVLCMVRHTTYCDDPARLSASAAIDQLRLSTSGDVLYLHHGWGSLIASLRAAATASGSTIRSGSRAIAIDTSGGRASSVTLDGGARLPAEAVIIAASPRTVHDLLPTAVDYRESTTPVRVASLDLALAALTRRRTTFAFGIDEPWSFSADSAVAHVAPTGGAVVHLVKYLGAGGPRDDEPHLERVLDVLQPGWRPSVIYRRFLPAMTVSHALIAADRGGFAGRPSGRVPGLENVFLAGDWVGRVGQLADASIASAVDAARAAAQLLAGSTNSYATE